MRGAVSGICKVEAVVASTHKKYIFTFSANTLGLYIYTYIWVGVVGFLFPFLLSLKYFLFYFLSKYKNDNDIIL